MSSTDPLFRRALLFSLAAHLATLAWVQAPVWDMTPPPSVIDARLEPPSEPTGPPPLPNTAPTPVQKQAAPSPMPAPLPHAIVVPAPAPAPAPISIPEVSPAAPPSAQPVTRSVPSTHAPMTPMTPVTLTATAHPVALEVPRVIPDGEWYPVRKLDAIPRRLGGAQPPYPESARSRGVTGSIKVRLRVNALGEVEAVESVSAQPEGVLGVFDASVRAFLMAARYQPPQRDGRPVRAVIEERFRFTLNDDF